MEGGREASDGMGRQEKVLWDVFEQSAVACTPEIA